MTEGAVERRIVTILNADLVGFTPLAELLDPEDLATVQDAYFAVVRETIGRHGGTIEKFIGDAVMAVFGVPVTRDDDAERAVRAGLALVAAVESLGARLGLEGDLALRVGIASGEVVGARRATAGDAIVTGDSLNVAARLQAAAPSGTVLLGETAALAVADAIELAHPEAIALKGKRDPVRVSRAVGVRPAPSRDFALAGLRAPTVGREHELRLLGSALARVAGGGSERWVLVAPPGVGKSRVLQELARASAAIVWTARLRAVQASPYEPVADLVRQALACAGLDLEDDSAPDRARRLLVERLTAAGASSARSVAVAEETLPLVWPVVATRSGGREAAFDAWACALDVLAGAHPVLWAVEDVHWASSDLLDFLEYATRAETTAGRLVLATARPALLERAPAWCDPATSSGLQLLHLPPLSNASTAGLVRALVGDLPPELLSRIVERAGGTPLFVEELLRTWISAGTLVPDGPRWRLAALPDVPLPTTVQAVYAAQLDDLPAAARELARLAAVVGRGFTARALAALGVEDVDEGLALLRRRALVEGPTDDTSGGRYVFRHALLRDAAYATLARADRSRLHVRLAGWLEAGIADDGGAATIAEHYAAAFETAPALAAQIGEGLSRAQVATRAAAWFERAGDHAVRFAARDTAQTLFARAVELTPERSLDRTRRLLRLGSATAVAASLTEGVRVVEEGLALVRSLPATEPARALAALAAAALGDLWMQQIRFADVVALTGEALPAAIGAGEPELRLRRTRAIGILGLTNEHAEALDDARRALAIAHELGSESLELDAHSWFLTGRAPDRVLLADADFERTKALAQRLGRWETYVQALENEALFLLDDDAGRACRLLDAAAEVAHARHLTEESAWVDYVRCEALLAAGRPTEALSAGRRAIESGRANGYNRVVLRSWTALVMVLGEPGSAVLEEAWPWWQAVRETVKAVRSPFAVVLSTAFEHSFAQAGLQPASLPELEPLLPSFRITYGSPGHLAAVDRLVGSWIDAGLNGNARVAVDLLAATQSHPAMSVRSRSHLALLRARLGHAEGAPPEEIAEHARRALDGFAACGSSSGVEAARAYVSPVEVLGST